MLIIFILISLFPGLEAFSQICVKCRQMRVIREAVTTELVDGWWFWFFMDADDWAEGIVIGDDGWRWVACGWFGGFSLIDSDSM